MRRVIVPGLLLVGLLAPQVPTTQAARAATAAQAGPADHVQLPAFEHSWSRITPALTARMRWSWRPGCPVPLSALRYVRVSFVGFDGKAHLGEIVVNAAVLSPVVGEFRTLYAERFPIRRMHLVDDYKGVDESSMAVDNTSSFNCRPVSGTSSWSMHAYGEAIDLNPVENPSLLDDDPHQADPPEGQAYLDRSPTRPGMVDAQVRAVFASYGWGWGGLWSDRDLMHFSSNGR